MATLQAEKAQLEKVIISLKTASPEEKEHILNAIHVTTAENRVCLKMPSTDALQSASKGSVDTSNEVLNDQSDEELDVAPFFSVDETGKIDSFGPSSALQAAVHRPPATESTMLQHIRNKLIVNATLQRQREYELYRMSDIDGVPTPLAMHLLDLHWSRQHHTFLLTYRPAITRDLLQGGPNCSKFLLQSIFACSSKFSQRLEVRDIASDPATAGGRFFRRCDELLTQESLLTIPTIPTIVGLLLLGSTFNALGMTSKGWLYTGYALRMVYDLGLHLDCKVTSENAERVEVRRRVFWGAFICDKLQSLYLGRPVGIQLQDAHVSRELLDTFEDREPFIRYSDPAALDMLPSLPNTIGPIYSTSTFQHLCLLSKIMTIIINKFYVVGATAAKAKICLKTMDNSLSAWKKNLPQELQLEPPDLKDSSPVPPNVLNLHGIYHSLIILLHRPLISDGHLRLLVPPESSWKRCSEAARNITALALAYRSIYSLRTAPYLLGYALYVACTIHVRNAAAENSCTREHMSLLTSSLECLDELSLPNPGVKKPAKIIRNLMRSSCLPEETNASHNSTSCSQDHLYNLVSVPDFDLDAILQMFSPKPPDNDSTVPLSEVASSITVSGIDNHTFDDILYGFMDMPPDTI